MSIVFCPHQVTPKVQQVVYSNMSSQETLRLMQWFKLAHTVLSHSCRLEQKLSSIIGILRCVMNRCRNQLPVNHPITSQFISNNLGFSSVFDL